MLNNYLYDFLSHVQRKNKGVPHTIQRSKGQSFLPVQTGENLCISYESLRFLRVNVKT